MARLHLRFRNIKPSVKRATETLFDSKPWSGTDEEKQSKYERWLRDASSAYGIPAPTLEIREDVSVRRGSGGYSWGRITLGAWSLTTMFHQFRHHLQAMGACGAEYGDCDDAQAWACSLFYAVKPRMFRKRVREGRIIGVDADDLLTSATLLARQEEMYEGEEPGDIAEDSPLSYAVDTVNGTHDSLRPDEDEEEAAPVPVIDASPEPVTHEQVNAAYLMATYGVSRSFVSDHAERMGGHKVASKWQFSKTDADAYMRAQGRSPINH